MSEPYWTGQAWELGRKLSFYRLPSLIGVTTKHVKGMSLLWTRLTVLLFHWSIYKARVLRSWVGLVCAIDYHDVQFKMLICSIENALKHWEMLVIIKVHALCWICQSSRRHYTNWKVGTFSEILSKFLRTATYLVIHICVRHCSILVDAFKWSNTWILWSELWFSLLYIDNELILH